jgi:phenylalanine-4-hydroxylase
MFTDPEVCDISHRIGILSLGASDQQIALLGSIYFYTLELGICQEDGERKFYGAAIASSINEIQNMLACEEVKELDLLNNPPPTTFSDQDIQSSYYLAESFSDVIR